MESKHNKQTTVQDTIERYVYQVTRRLPGKGRKDIEAELRGLIEDMLEQRCGDILPTKKDLDVVLTELGAPAEFAARYGNSEGKPRYLIGPGIFPQYLMVLKIVLSAVLFGLMVAFIVERFAEPGAIGFALIGAWLGSILSALFSAAAAITLVFGIFEWKGVNLDGLNGDWLNDLPPVPKPENRFSRGECIGGIAASSLFLLLCVVVPRYVGVSVDGNVIHLLDMDVYARLMPLIAASCALGVCKEVAKLLEGRYTMRLAIGMTIADVVGIALCVLVLSQPIWNRSLILLLEETADLSNAGFLEKFWNSFGQVFLGLVLVGFVADLVSLWVHTLRAVRAQ